MIPVAMTLIKSPDSSDAAKQSSLAIVTILMQIRADNNDEDRPISVSALSGVGSLRVPTFIPDLRVLYKAGEFYTV